MGFLLCSKIIVRKEEQQARAQRGTLYLLRILLPEGCG
jgi:hypothetical protein